MSMSAGKERSASRLRGALTNLAAWLSLIGRSPRFKAGRLLPPRIRLAVGTATGVVLVGAAMLLLDTHGVAFGRALAPEVVDTFNEITDYGKSGWFLVPLGGLIVLAAILATPAAGRVTNLVLAGLAIRFSYVFLAIAVPGLAVSIIKRIIGRVRPSELGPFAYVPWSWRHEYASLPSGHTTTAVAAAVAIGALWPAARIPMWIFAAVIAASRVVIHAHFVSDTIAAAFVGAFGAILVRNWYAARRLAFVPGVDGGVHALPGPSWRRLKAVARRLFGQ